MGNYNNNRSGDDLTPGGCLLVLIGLPTFWLLPPMLLGEFFNEHFLLSYIIVWGPLIGFWFLHETAPKSKEEEEKTAQWKAERKKERERERQEERERRRAWLRSLPSKIKAKHAAAALIVLIAVIALAVNMPSREDRKLAAALDERIQQFFNESRVNDPEIEAIEAAYGEMTDRQKKLVRRYDILQEVEEFLNSPTGRVKRSDLNGFWKMTAPDPDFGYTGYYLINSKAFWMGTRGRAPSRSELAAPEYLAATKITLEHYDLEKKALKGKIYFITDNWPTVFFVTVGAEGTLTMTFEKPRNKKETYVKVTEEK